jgi:Zn-dependent M28 family amino/carboxypeptidase
MFGVIFGLSGGGFAALALLLMAILWVAYRFFTASTPLSNVHPGKQSTHSCKFDSAEVERTRGILKPAIAAETLIADARISERLARVDVAVVRDAMNALSGETAITIAGRTDKIVSRNSFGPGVELAMLFLEEYYRSLGIQTVREPYKVRGKTLYNLIATIPGKSARVLIIGSHLDSTAGRTHSPEAVAPGADDDASGTVAVMELARALKDLPLGCTVRLCHFTGEEQGLYGSYVHSDAVAKAKLDVVAMLQMDMVSYCGKPGNRLDIHDAADRNGSHSLLAKFVAAKAAYGINLNIVDTHNHAVDDRSDHAGFLDHGYKAVLLSEEFTDDGFNPNYHSVNDRVKNVNLPYMVEVVRLAIATSAELAELQR